MKQLLLGLVVAFTTALSVAGSGVEGVWKTETSESGGHLEVTVGPCESDNSRICGVITKAFSSQGEDPSYVNLGKLIAWDMEPHGENSYKGGMVWDPEHDKTYKSKMHLKGDNLDVEGCISFICIGEDWTRVN